MSWQLVAILFTIAAFEGVRRLAPDELVLRCNPFGVWSVATPLQLWRDWHVVSFLPPFFLTIVIAPGVGASALSNRGCDPLFAIAGRAVLALRVLGVLNFVLLILGIPWAVSRFGAAGLVGFLGIAFALSVSASIMAAILLTAEGLSRGIALRKAASLASPFASPLAAETVLSARMRRCPRLAVVSQLVSETRFRQWIRPWAYDLESRGSSMRNAWLEEIALSLSTSERAGILTSASEGCRAGERYCPRCGEKYLLEWSFCAECEGIGLRLP